MKIFSGRLVIILVLSIGLGIPASRAADDKTSGKEKRTLSPLHLYGPGGPLYAMEECGNVFFKKTGREVKIRTGMPQHWVDEAKQKGDLIFEGSESMLNDFMQTFPGVVDESSITGLYARSAAILVRKGNPKSIKTLSDSAKEGMKIVVITQEKMEEVYGRVPGIHYNIVLPLLTGRQAAQAWKTTPELDAWITYESWHYALKDETDLVQLSERERVLRITPVVAIRTSRNREAVREFINFLKTEEAHKIFQKWGWK